MSITAKKGLCYALNTSVFDYGQKSVADQTIKSWEKIVQYVRTNYGRDISNELQNKITVNLVKPFHTPKVTARQTIREWMIRTGQANIQNFRAIQRTILEFAVTATIDDTAPTKLAILENETAQGDYE